MSRMVSKIFILDKEKIISDIFYHITLIGDLTYF